jgi:hypothetical protein
VTFLALHYGVRAEEREPVVVLLNRLHGNLPAQHRVALLAVGAKLPAMNIRMAIRAILADVGEYRLGMAAGTRNFFVHAAQGILRRVMIEFGDGANGRPACVRMAIFAWDCERTVRTSPRLPLGLRRQEEEKHEEYRREPTVTPQHSQKDCPQTLELSSDPPQ